MHQPYVWICKDRPSTVGDSLKDILVTFLCRQVIFNFFFTSTEFLGRCRIKVLLFPERIIIVNYIILSRPKLLFFLPLCKMGKGLWTSSITLYVCIVSEQYGCNLQLFSLLINPPIILFHKMSNSVKNAHLNFPEPSVTSLKSSFVQNRHETQKLLVYYY